MEEERELREFLIYHDVVKITGKEQDFMSKNIRIDVYSVTKLIKDEILKVNPSVNFTTLGRAPEDPINFLNRFKDDLIYSCLDDLEQKMMLQGDSTGYISEINAKISFSEVFPNFPTSKVEQLLELICDRKKPTPNNMYQEKLRITEIINKIYEGKGYKNDDIEGMQASQKVGIAKEISAKEVIDKKNGEFLAYYDSIVQHVEKPPSLDNLIPKLNTLFRTLRENEEFRKRALGQNNCPTMKEEIDALPLTLPLIKFSIHSDYKNQGTLPLKIMVQMIVDHFPSISDAEAYLMAGFGKNQDQDIVDYMQMCKVIERILRRNSIS